MSAPMALELEVASLSVAGQRSANEDHVLARPRWLLVADGVGGGPAGADAARLACQAADRSLGGTSRNPVQALVDAFTDAASALRDHSDRVPAARGLSTTLSAAIVTPLDGGGRLRLDVAWLGDSPIICVRRGTSVLEMLGGDVPRHDRHLDSWLSDRGVVAPRVVTTSLVAGDALLVASDGIEPILDHDGICPLLPVGGQRGAAAEVALSLVAGALAADAVDNVTVAVALCHGGGGPGSTARHTSTTTHGQEVS